MEPIIELSIGIIIIFSIICIYRLYVSPMIYVDYFYKVIAKKKQHEIETKFYSLLLQHAHKLGIFMKDYDTLEDLNTDLGYGEKSDQATAVYRYSQLALIDKEYAANEKLPMIHYSRKETKCYSFAHEIGHHMIAIEGGTQSEEEADKRVYDIAKRLLPIEDIKWISSWLMVYYGKEIQETRYGLYYKAYLKESIKDRLIGSRVFERKMQEYTENT